MSSGGKIPPQVPTIEEEVFRNGHEFDFFQAVSILESIYSDRQNVGKPGTQKPTVRFAAHATSSSFAASQIYEVQPATTQNPTAKMTVSFMGLTGPSGVLPQHYTELLNRIEIESHGPQKYAMRDWFDLFNDRLISLFYRSWQKYRPFASYAKAIKGESDSFTSALQSIAGLGMPSLAKQCRLFVPQIAEVPASPQSQSPDADLVEPSAVESTSQLLETKSKTESPALQSKRESPLELAMLRYSGLLSQRPRCAINLQNLLQDYFQLPIDVKQFHGNWLSLDETAQTRLGVLGGNSVLGENAVIGNQTWERQNKILIAVGPLEGEQFSRMLPEYQSEFVENDYQLLTKLVRLFAGPEIEFDVQLTIKSDSIPQPEVTHGNQDGLRLGWNTWLTGEQGTEIVSSTLLSAA